MSRHWAGRKWLWRFAQVGVVVVVLLLYVVVVTRGRPMDWVGW